MAKPATRKSATALKAAQQRAVPVNPPTAPSKELHVFPNPSPERDYVIQFQIPEFTCHCPLTGQPDFAHFTIDMVADQLLSSTQSWSATMSIVKWAKSGCPVSGQWQVNSGIWNWIT